MRILHVGQMIGGLDTYIRNSVIYSGEALQHVIVHGASDASEPVVRNTGAVREYKTSLKRAIGLRDLLTLREVMRIIRKEKPDLVHCHSAKGGIIGRMAAYFTHTPVAYTPHAFSFLSSQNSFKRWVFKFAEKITRGNAYVLACSPSEQELAIKAVGYSPAKSLTWTNAVPDCKDAIGSTENPELDSLGRFICYIGRPSYQKNMELLVETASLLHKRHPDVKIALLGVGYYSPDLGKLESLIAQRGLKDMFVLKPWLSHDQCLAYVKKALLYLTTSRYEGLPLSVIESMSLSKAIVGTKVIGNIDCIENGVNGFLASDAEELANACSVLIEDDSLRSKFESNSREIFEKSFDITTRISSLEECYRKIICSQNPSKSE